MNTWTVSVRSPCLEKVTHLSHARNATHYVFAAARALLPLSVFLTAVTRRRETKPYLHIYVVNCMASMAFPAQECREGHLRASP